jgi:hypothetical protein
MSNSLPLLRRLPLYVISAILAATVYPAIADPDNKPAPVALSFVEQGHLLPRRSHQTIGIATTNLRSVDLTLMHLSEADTLPILLSGDVGVSTASEPLWHGPLAISGTDGHGSPGPGEKVITPFDVMAVAGGLQPGVYVLTANAPPFVHESMWFTISNLGIEAFTGQDGVSAQVRLLSEGAPAQNVEVALLARNNREIARARTNADGVVHFALIADALKGEDAPAALYAYGADGEFTALSLQGKPVLFDSAPAKPALPAVWFVTDKDAYKLGEVMRGVALARGPDGHTLDRPLYAQLRRDDGRLADEQRLTPIDGGLFAFTLHAPPEDNEQWKINMVGGDASVLGTAPVMIGGKPAEIQPPGTSQEVPQPIVIAPGRRSFQPGETANISVQPPFDADVTLAVLDNSVHAVVRQHIGKEGGVVQLPMPADASGGVYVLATAFSPPDDAAKRSVQRSFGLQWLDIDEGSKRMGVRVDTPEMAAAGSTVPVKITLPDLGGKPGGYMVIGMDDKNPARPDPIGFFYGKHPVGAAIWDDYGDVIGGTPQPKLPDTSSALMPGVAWKGMSLVWNGPAATKNGDAVATLAMPSDKAISRLRLSVVAASDDRLGVAETGIGITPAREKTAAVHPQPAAAVKRVSVTGRGTVPLKAGQMAYLSSLPIVAAPIWIDDHSQPHFSSSADPDTLELVRAVSAGISDPGQVVYLTLVSQHDPAFPLETRKTLRDALLALVGGAQVNDDTRVTGLYALYHGQELPLWAEAMVRAATPEKYVARLARFALLKDEADYTALMNDGPDSDDEGGYDDEPEADRIERTILTQQIAMDSAKSVPLPSRMLHSLSDYAFSDKVSWQDRLGLRLIQSQVDTGRKDLPAGIAGPPQPGDDPAVVKAEKPMTMRLAKKDPSTMYALILSNWPTRPPQ